MRPWTQSLLTVAFMATWVHEGHAQLPSFLQALYGVTTTNAPIKAPIKVPRPAGQRPHPPPPPPPYHPRPANQNQPRIDRQSAVDDIYIAATPNSINNQIITASSPSPNFDSFDNNLDSYNNIPLSNPLLSQPQNVQPKFGVPNNPTGSFSSNPAPSTGSFTSNGVSPTGSFASSPSDFSDSSWPLSQPDLAKITNIQVQCEKTSIRVNVDFDRPFYGMVFSKGHFSDPNCVHLQSGSGATSTVFEIQMNQCGMTASGGFGSDNGQPNPAGSFIESTIIVQYDPLVQEVWDQARKLRCTWYDYYEKSVTFRPFQVNMLNAVTANFLGDNLQCWMQIQSGKGPWSSEVSGIVKIGQTMTMVLGIKDEDNKFDMVVRNCVAHDGKRTPIQLVNELGCVIRPKIMSKFNKIKNFGSSATVVSYAYFQAFKFPDSMNVHFQCVIQVCRFNCPDPVCPEDTAQAPTFNVQASVTAAPAFGDAPAAPNEYVVNPRTPSVLPATRRNFRSFGGTRFNARSGRDHDVSSGTSPEMFSFSDANGMSFQHHYNMNNPYYQGYQNHRVKRHEEAMKKSSLGEVKTNSTFQVLSPDDVAFKLPTVLNFNDSTVESAKEWTPDYSICVTLTNTSGILFLTFMSIIVISITTSAIITWRRCVLKRKKYGNKVGKVVMNKVSKLETMPKKTPEPPKKMLEQKENLTKSKK